MVTGAVEAAGTTLALFGPTAVGKTDVALAVADLLRERGEDPVAISADALQIYEGLDVLTATATVAECARLEHRLISFVPIDDVFTVARYARAAHTEIDGLLAAGRRPIVVGGTGLYLRAALADLDFRGESDPAIRARWERFYDAEGGQAAMAELMRRTSSDADRTFHHRDRKRVVRELELVDAGTPPPDRGELWSGRMRHPTCMIGLTMPFPALDLAIDLRVDAMMEAGALAEVERAIDLGASVTAVKATGFLQLAGVVRGERTLLSAGDEIKRKSKRYARRQLTWMRKIPDITVIDRGALDGSAPCADAVVDALLDADASTGLGGPETVRVGRAKG